MQIAHIIEMKKVNLLQTSIKLLYFPWHPNQLYRLVYDFLVEEMNPLVALYPVQAESAVFISTKTVGVI